MTKHFGWVPHDPEDPDAPPTQELLYLLNLEEAIDRRCDAEMSSAFFVSTIEELIQDVDKPANRPINDLIVGGHASRQGFWGVSPFFGEAVTDFEALAHIASVTTNVLDRTTILQR